jgi:large subunit ribosomal protein L7/L12
MSTLSYVMIGGLVLVLVLMVFRQSFGGWRPPSIDSAMAPQLNLPDAVRARVDLLLAQGKKIEAIKEVRAATNAGLKQAKDYVDGLEAGFGPRVGAYQPPTVSAAAPAARMPIVLSPEAEREVRREIAAGNTILAIKLVREATSAGLKECKDFVEGLAAGERPFSVAASFQPPAAGMPIVLSPDVEHRVRQALAAGNKIAAIKLVREATSAGLKDAKDFVEQM